jgi:hypothetical protein
VDETKSIKIEKEGYSIIQNWIREENTNNNNF